VPAVGLQDGDQAVEQVDEPGVADVRAAATDPQTFLSYEGIDIDDTAKDQSGPGFLPDIDNPRHDQIRRMIQPQLLPNRIAERRPR